MHTRHHSLIAALILHRICYFTAAAAAAADDVVIFFNSFHRIHCAVHVPLRCHLRTHNFWSYKSAIAVCVTVCVWVCCFYIYIFLAYTKYLYCVIYNCSLPSRSPLFFILFLSLAQICLSIFMSQQQYQQQQHKETDCHNWIICVLKKKEQKNQTNRTKQKKEERTNEDCCHCCCEECVAAHVMPIFTLHFMKLKN